MDLQLKGKQAIVTGSTAGIGFAIARAGGGGRSDGLQQQSTEARGSGDCGNSQNASERGDFRRRGGCVSTAEGCAKLVEVAPSADTLVNNVGTFEPKPFERISDEDWPHVFEANVMSGIRLSRHYLAGMRE